MIRSTGVTTLYPAATLRFLRNARCVGASRGVNGVWKDVVANFKEGDESEVTNLTVHAQTDRIEFDYLCAHFQGVDMTFIEAKET